MTDLRKIYDTLLADLKQTEEEEHDDEDEGSPVVAKIVAMCVLFLASFTLGTLPIKLSKWFQWENNPKNNKIVICLLCFGGGVLLCTTFLHLLPEVAEGIEHLQEENKIADVKMHLAEFMMCAGFFIMYFVEECVHWYLHRRTKNNDLNAIRRSLSIRRGDTPESNGTTVSTTDLIENMEADTKTVNGHSHDHGHGHSHLVLEDTVVRSLRGLLIVLALSVHELFEGLAVGLESSPQHVWYMFGAVSAHKLVIAFCIGVELVTAKTNVILSVIYVFTFAIVSPMGIGIGIGISGNESEATEIASTFLQGLATGTLLYVVFFEILQKDRKGGLKQYLSVLVGFLVMLGLTFLGKLFFFQFLFSRNCDSAHCPPDMLADRVCECACPPDLSCWALLAIPACL